MIDLLNQIANRREELTRALKKMYELGRTFAEAQRDYNVALSQETLKLKSRDMSVTLITYVVKGLDKVAELRMKRDIAEAQYEANKEHINALKLELRLLESQIAREWGRND